MSADLGRLLSLPGNFRLRPERPEALSPGLSGTALAAFPAKPWVWMPETTSGLKGRSKIQSHTCCFEADNPSTPR